MSKKKKTMHVGTISGLDALRRTRPPQDIPFRTGGHTTQKDKPRDKSYKKWRKEYE